jgi:hypothetical protein
MDSARFDTLARTLATSGSRRRVLGGLLAGALAGVRVGPASADDVTDTVIADARGGNANTATVVEPTQHHDDHDKDTQETCQPDSERQRCDGRCNRVVNDGCGGEIRCTCDGDKVCAREDEVCCQPDLVCEDTRVCCQKGEVCGPSDTCCPPEQLCAGKQVCCGKGEVCGPGDACCPIERACFSSGECCPAGTACTQGGGTCCLLKDFCEVGGVKAACCPSGRCVNGVCQA